MEYASKAFTNASPPIDGAMSRPRPPRSDLATGWPGVQASSAQQVEWAILCTSPVNGLLVGADQLTAAAMAGIEKSVQQPVVWWAPDQAADVPELAAGTLVIRDVDRLDVLQQERLLRWIGVHCPGVQVLALARASLFAQVAEGRFSAALYYRMNTVLVEVRAPTDLP
jgi:sigma-54-interacting transcriptional regulator